MKQKDKMFPFFVSIPHSGVKIPDMADWLKKIDLSILMCDVDAFVDDLYCSALTEFHIPFVFFEWHRYSVDVNRFSTDISEGTVEGVKARFIKRDQKQNSQGLNKMKSPSDLHWQSTTKGDRLIKKPISRKRHEALIKKYFEPFHKNIQHYIENYQKKGFKNVYLLDLHSMPSEGLSFHRDIGEQRKDVVIGDNEGQSGSKSFRDLVIKAYQQSGFEVALNWPYKGGALTQTYGQPHLGQHCLQVELNRKLYMNEQTKEKTSNYRNVQNQLKKAIYFILQNQTSFLE